MGPKDAWKASRPLLWLRSAGNLVNLSTPLGMVIACLGRASVRRADRGLFLAEHYRLPFPVAGAFTVGNVIVTSGEFETLGRRHPQLLQHEEAHTWQYLYCGGIPYWFCYSACLAWSVLRTGDRAAANFFEVRAGLRAGGYPHRPTRPIGTGLRSLLRRRS
jgi:hypothetical protein